MRRKEEEGARDRDEQEEVAGGGSKKKGRAERWRQDLLGCGQERDLTSSCRSSRPCDTGADLTQALSGRDDRVGGGTSDEGRWRCRRKRQGVKLLEEGGGGGKREEG
eukprot:757677-Hanusia_phi.AAC.4